MKRRKYYSKYWQSHKDFIKAFRLGIVPELEMTKDKAMNKELQIRDSQIMDFITQRLNPNK